MDDLWRFALAAWRVPGVERISLGLQDQHHFQVPILLAAAWLGLRGVEPDRQLLASLRASADAWQPRLLALRSLRREASTTPAWQEWKRLLADAELEAERLLLSEMAALLQAHPRSSHAVTPVLEWLLLCAQDTPDNAVLQLLTALADVLAAHWPQGI